MLTPKILYATIVSTYLYCLSFQEGKHAMKKKLLVEFLQISDILKFGDKHYRKQDKPKFEHNENLGSERHINKNGKHRTKKMSFTTRTTLWLLLKHGSLNQRNIAKSMNISAQAVSKIIKKLLEKELIDKKNGSLNNENIIVLTDKGKLLAERIDNKITSLSDAVFYNFTETEIETLNSLIKKMELNRERVVNDIDNIKEEDL